MVRCDEAPPCRTLYGVIELKHLTKRYGSTLAVDDLSFTARPGHVTGFLGPNGAGKPANGLGRLRFNNDA